MQIKNIKVQIQRDGAIWSTHSGKWQVVNNPMIQKQLRDLVKMFRSKKYTTTMKDLYFDNTMRSIKQIEDASNKRIIIDEQTFEKTKDVMSKLIAFFAEFSFEPNFRFVNTLCNYAIKDGIDGAKEYITNYFNLVDHQYKTSIVEKMKSFEFDDLLIDMQKLTCTKTVNKRFKVYYGSQGTGKTTSAMNETNNLCMVCHSAMLPADLMEDFKFEDGNPSFKPSALQEAIVNGRKIVLDEINLLPFESLRFLQSILDGKTEFVYKGKTINIKEGFQIIGTMNLVVNGCTFSLPEPLIDRACELRKYTLTADSLIGALI